ncbi:MAG TPA: DUF29 domain-containing protein [Stellaceae bacterium]|jgi:hypothetical protein
MSDTKTLYREDVFAWSKEQAEALRSAAHGGSNQTLDWENLAEEIESVGASQKLALRSQMRRIVEHLLKLQFSPAADPRRGWFETVGDARSEIEDLFQTSPSLRAEANAAVPSVLRLGSRKALRELEQHGELDRTLTDRIRVATYTIEQILDEDWFPPEPQG